MKHDKHQGKHKKHKKKYTKKEITTEIKNIALIIVGSIILGIGTGIFLVPFNIVAGGVTGLGIVINEWLSPIIPEVAFEFISGIGLVKETVGPLLGQAPSKEMYELIENKILDLGNNIVISRFKYVKGDFIEEKLDEDNKISFDKLLPAQWAIFRISNRG